MPKFIEFIPGNPIDGKPAWKVCNKKSGTMIAAVLWYPTWRMYVAQFDPDSIWSEDCLKDVREFMLSLKGKP